MKIQKLFYSLFFLALPEMLISQNLLWAKKANPTFNSINSVAFNASGTKVLSGTNCHPASIRMFDVSSSNLDWDYTVDTSYMCIMGIRFSNNNNYIASIEEFGNIFIFDNTGPSPIIKDTINTGTSYGFSVTVSPDNVHVAVGCSNGKLKIYNIADGTLHKDINAHPSWVTSVSYAPNGQYIVSGGNDDKVKLWDTAGILLATFNGHTQDITQVKFSSTSTELISSSKDKSIRIWDISTGLLVRTLLGHSGFVNSFDISPDDTKIVSGSTDSLCKIWNYATGDEIVTFGVKDSGSVNTVAWSPMGNKIATGNQLSDLMLWDVQSTLTAPSITNTELELLVYPNPSIGIYNISSKSKALIQNIQVYNFLGQLIIQQNLTNKIDLSHLQQGEYILHCETMDQEVYKKILIKH
jgi:WD40 repeat protein